MQSVPQNLPVGWRFRPTNEELLDHYLKNKRLGLPISGFDIQDIQICDFDPWDLIDKSSRSKERYLFCRRQFHLKTGGIQRKRKAKAVFWKRTGEIQFITREDSDEVIGTKTIFVYHDPTPTEFVKHEYELTEEPDSPVQVCANGCLWTPEKCFENDEEYAYVVSPISDSTLQQTECGMNQSVRESDFKAFWFTRNQAILDWLLYERSSIICLQEFWVGNEELVHMYQQGLGDAGYVTFQLGRTNNRGDGLLTAVHKDYFEVLNYQDLLFNDFGDRVAQLLHVRSTVPLLQNRKGDAPQEFLIVNTHLLFPHNSSLSIVRLHQVYKILQHVEKYQRENKLNSLPVILCGDWNGSKRGHVYKFLRSQGFVSSYDNAHQYTDTDADAHKWVSHRNHRGNICGVDFIWLRNPTNSRKLLKRSWFEAIVGIMKRHLLKASLSEKDAFAFLKADEPGDFITYSAFCEGLRQMNLIGLPYGLSYQQAKDIWIQVDTDGNGIVDYEEFKQRIWNLTCPEEEENCVDSSDEAEEGVGKETIGFSVKNAFLFPREAENGMWPENYSLSDHARLTVVFSPVRLNSY